MYIWVAIDVDEQVMELREYAECYVKEHGLSSPTLSLPFHISLKISFEIPDEKRVEVTRDIRDLFKSQEPFTIPVGAVEKNASILWLTRGDSPELASIHNRLDELMLKEYGVTRHEFDKAFIFHTSVLILNSEEQICRAQDAIKAVNIPSTLVAKKIIIGSSESGRAGTYIVDEELVL